MPYPIPLSEKLWSKVKVLGPNDCWLFEGYCKPDGYATVFHDGKARPVHRLVYEEKFGPINSQLVVCHKCDCRNCCNPSHLFAGTMKDNILDCASKYRLRGASEQTLSPNQIREIRKAVGTTREIGTLFNIDSARVYRIKNRQIYSYVEDDPMIIVSEQQTFAKLRLAPMDFVELLDKDPAKALEYITQLQGEREKPVGTRKAKDPNKTSPTSGKRGRQQAGLDLDNL